MKLHEVPWVSRYRKDMVIAGIRFRSSLDSLVNALRVLEGRGYRYIIFDGTFLDKGRCYGIGQSKEMREWFENATPLANEYNERTKRQRIKRLVGEGCLTSEAAKAYRDCVSGCLLQISDFIKIGKDFQKEMKEKELRESVWIMIRLLRSTDECRQFFLITNYHGELEFSVRGTEDMGLDILEDIAAVLASYLSLEPTKKRHFKNQNYFAVGGFLATVAEELLKCGADSRAAPLCSLARQCVNEYIEGVGKGEIERIELEAPISADNETPNEIIARILEVEEGLNGEPTEE